jgi:hypothetical protein
VVWIIESPSLKSCLTGKRYKLCSKNTQALQKNLNVKKQNLFQLFFANGLSEPQQRYKKNSPLSTVSDRKIFVWIRILWSVSELDGFGFYPSPGDCSRERLFKHHITAKVLMKTNKYFWWPKYTYGILYMINFVT